jgi:maltose alpha-D-glucosyltransferase/alpha-amylase
MNNPWFKNAIIYSLDVRTFSDGDGNGTGDFKGLTKSLDYIADLGATCLWLRPFYTSPGIDDGNDISDFISVDPAYGTMDDFIKFMEKASSLQLRVIIELVLHHTSDQHPWFLEGRADKKSKYKSYYIWTGKEPEGNEKDFWNYDEMAQEFYLHRYLKEEPDLDTSNPEVKEEIRNILRFWLDKGVSGFNIDIAHIMADIEPLTSKKSRDYTVLKLINETVSEYSDIMLLTSAEDIAGRLAKYVGNNDRMNVLYNRAMNQNIFLTLAREESAPVENELKRLPIQPETSQWLNMLVDQGLLRLDNLLEDERQEIFSLFAPEPDMRIDNALRRRLAPMVSNDRRQMELLYSLLFSLPGIPGIMYGEEIGMGEDLSIPGAGSIRTAMQWNAEQNAGFTASEGSSIPVNSNGEYGSGNINVASQKQEKDSFLNWMKKLIRTRIKCTEIGLGRFSTIDTDNPDIFIHRLSTDENIFIAVHNLSGNETRLNMNMSLIEGRIIFADINETGSFSEIAPYGYRWLLLPAKTVNDKNQ